MPELTAEERQAERVATAERWAQERPCAWAIANPDRMPPGARFCIGWSCRSEPKNCHRKRDAANRRKAEQSAYRKFPGNDVQQARSASVLAADDSVGPDATFDERMEARDAVRLPKGRCNWCEGEILKPGGAEVNLRRGWHDGRGGEPDCLGDFFAHTRAEYQLRLLQERDGPACRCCGERKASDVDHVLALALVVLQIAPAERWRYWGPMNLQGLCSRCHADKTAADVRLIKAARKLDALEEAI